MSVLEPAVVSGWPLALTIAAIVVRDRLRAARRRGALNRALHELRRPLQALALLPEGAGRNGGSEGGMAPGKLELALAALDDLDRNINGGEAPVRLRPVPCRPWVEGAVGRWRVAAGDAGSPVELRWRAGSATVLADPRLLAQALDNLIVNAIEHGGPPIRVEASVADARVRIAVLDGGRGLDPRPGGPGRPPGWRRLGELARRLGAGGRRGHGLEVVAWIAAEHGGRFMVRRGERGTVAALELPLAGRPSSAIATVAAA
jgi:signal transduction histidine kinase